jgi:hypothetical protein
MMFAEQDGPVAPKATFARRSRHCQIFQISTRCSAGWLIDHVPCGLSIREDENPITANNSRWAARDPASA